MLLRLMSYFASLTLEVPLLSVLFLLATLLFSERRQIQLSGKAILSNLSKPLNMFPTYVIFSTHILLLFSTHNLLLSSTHILLPKSLFAFFLPESMFYQKPILTKHFFFKNSFGACDHCVTKSKNVSTPKYLFFMFCQETIICQKE